MFREEEGKRDVWRIDDTGSISGSDRSCTSGDRNQRAETQYPDEEAKAQRTGKILRISHVEKRDEEGFLIQNYYETRIEYVENGHRQQATVKSVDEFQEGEEVRILKDNERGGQLRIVENEKSAVFGPWILIGAGILIISMPFVQKQYGDAYVSAILAALMFLTGAALCASYGKDKKEIPKKSKQFLQMS